MYVIELTYFSIFHFPSFHPPPSFPPSSPHQSSHLSCSSAKSSSFLVSSHTRLGILICCLTGLHRRRMRGELEVGIIGILGSGSDGGGGIEIGGDCGGGGFYFFHCRCH